jgi:cyclopropane-fatty-acyl-phospholipid synthase
MSFREQDRMVFQIQLTKRQNVVPMTRDYIMREEQRLLAAEGKRRPPLRLAGE